MPDDAEAVAGLLAELRDAIARHPILSQLTIDEYQLGFYAEAGFGVTAYTAWTLRSRDGSVEHLEGDLRERSSASYAICRIIGRAIVSLDFDAAGNFVVGLDDDAILIVARREESENFTISTGTTRAGVPGLYVF